MKAKHTVTHYGTEFRSPDESYPTGSILVAASMRGAVITVLGAGVERPSSEEERERE